MSNSIILAGGYRKLQSKVLASGQTPKPGTLLKLTSGDELTSVHTLGQPAEKLVALEDALQGKSVEDAYVAGTVCDCALFDPGAEAQVLVAAGENLAIGDYLVADAAGMFVKATAIPPAATGQDVLAVATAALDLSASGAVDTLCNIRFI